MRWRAAPRGRRAWAALALALAALGAAQLRLPVAVTTEAELGAPPAAVAQLLAEMPRRAAPRAWRVEADGGNYTSWRYRASFSCGRGCAGLAAVEAHARYGGHPRHGLRSAPEHLVRVAVRTCSWARPLCELAQAETRVRGDGAGGSRLLERASAGCGLLRALRGACEAELRAERLAHLRRLRRALAELPPH